MNSATTRDSLAEAQSLREAKRAAEKALLEHHIAAGLSIRDIAGRMGWSARRAANSLRCHGLKPRRAEHWEAL